MLVVRVPVLSEQMMLVQPMAVEAPLSMTTPRALGVAP
jgi:hypothetical protein